MGLRSQPRYSVLWYMLITKTVHSSSRRQPYHHDLRPLQSIRALAAAVLVGVLSLAVVAVIWSRLYPGLSHYPVAAGSTAPRRPDSGEAGMNRICPSFEQPCDK